MQNDSVATVNDLSTHRSLLFLPASVVADTSHPLPDFYYRCASARLPAEYRPDIFILDLEDSVPLPNRAYACTDAMAFAEHVSEKANVQLFLRVTGSVALRELELRVAAEPSIKGIVFPKVEPATIAAMTVFFDVGKPIWPIIETARGFLHKSEVIGTVRERQPAAFPVCAILGRDDLASSLRIDRDTLNATKFAVLFLDFVFACRAYGCDAIGPVFNQPDDTSGLVEELSALSTLGFSGTLSVFPPQIREVNRAFTPSEDLRSRCLSIHSALTDAHKRGVGWTMYDGRKYDTADFGYLDYILSR